MIDLHNPAEFLSLMVMSIGLIYATLAIMRKQLDRNTFSKNFLLFFTNFCFTERFSSDFLPLFCCLLSLNIFRLRILLLPVQLKGRITKTEMDQSIDFLSNEGHIYSTVDEDHFKSTEGD